MRILLLFLCFAVSSCAYPFESAVSSTKASDQSPSLRRQVVPGTTYGNAALQQATLSAVKQDFSKREGASPVRTAGYSRI